MHDHLHIFSSILPYNLTRSLPPEILFLRYLPRHHSRYTIIRPRECAVFIRRHLSPILFSAIRTDLSTLYYVRTFEEKNSASIPLSRYIAPRKSAEACDAFKRPRAILTGIPARKCILDLISYSNLPRRLAAERAFASIRALPARSLLHRVSQKLNLSLIGGMLFALLCPSRRVGPGRRMRTGPEISRRPGNCAKTHDYSLMHGSHDAEILGPREKGEMGRTRKRRRLCGMRAGAASRPPSARLIIVFAARVMRVAHLEIFRRQPRRRIYRDTSPAVRSNANTEEEGGRVATGV